MDNSLPRLTIRVAWWMQILLLAVTVPLAASAIFGLISLFKDFASGLVMFVFSAPFAYMFGANALSTIQITDQSVTVNVFYGRFRISWTEVNKIMVNNGPLIALVGNGKRVVVSVAFAGQNAAKMMEFFEQQAKLRGIDIEQGAPFPITHQNAGVWP